MTFVLLTGATRGIGRAAAVELARQGAEVALVGRDSKRVEAVVAEAKAAGGGAEVHGHTADLSLMSEVRMPSKKWMNGTRERSVAACATSAMS